MGKKAGKFRKIIISCTAAFLILCMSGCSVTDMGGTKKQELDFTVLEKEDIPEELKIQIEEKKDEPMKLTYTDQGQMYLVRGYGKKESSGYSIEVKKLYETENAIHICTELKGPGEKEQVIEKNTWPYLVVKLDYQDRHVVFEE